jgi:hypothetical protein
MKVDMNRVCVYVDGFNLYFGLKSKGWRKHYWLNLEALSTSLLKPGQRLETVHYFTSRIRINGNNPKKYAAADLLSGGAGHATEPANPLWALP